MLDFVEVGSRLVGNNVFSQSSVVVWFKAVLKLLHLLNIYVCEYIYIYIYIYIYVNIYIYIYIYI